MSRVATVTVAAVVALGLLPASGATARSKHGLLSVSCANYVGGAAFLVDDFTAIRATGVSCTTAHTVLEIWSDPALGNAYHGFVCRTTKSSVKSTIDVKCVVGHDTVAATDTQTKTKLPL
jgi:hypothetical protein